MNLSPRKRDFRHSQASPAHVHERHPTRHPKVTSACIRVDSKYGFARTRETRPYVIPNRPYPITSRGRNVHVVRDLPPLGPSRSVILLRFVGHDKLAQGHGYGKRN